MSDHRPAIRLLPKTDPRALRRGFPWAYANQLVMDRRSRSLTPGSIAQLQASDRSPLATVAVNPASKIAARVLDADPEAVIDRHFKGNGRIPTAAVTGTNGKTTTSNILGFILARSGLCTGIATTNELAVDGDLLADGDSAGAPSAVTLLADPKVEAAVLETAHGGISAHGLAYDVCNVSAVTNVSYDHVGTNGIDSIEHMAACKEVVARSSTDLTVLNADDPHCVGMIPRLQSRQLCLVTAAADIDIRPPMSPLHG